MKVIYGIGKVKKTFHKVALAIGVFDGMHLGHQKLITTAVKQARALKGKAVVMTFSPHPVHVLYPQISLPYIISLSYRIKLMESLGVAVCIVVHFTKRFSHMTPQKFMERYLVEKIQPNEIFIGDDFRFGKNREGTLEFFKKEGKKYGFKVKSVDSVKGGKNKIGSSRIRELIVKGKLSQARKLLGRNVSVMGKVVKGDQRGKQLGFPTANLFLEHQIIVPMGVYAVNVRFNNKLFHGMANVGCRPSFKSTNNGVIVEVHIFRFNKNLYGMEIVVEFLKKIRTEKIFNSKEKLKQQLKADEKKVKKLFKL